MKNLINIATEEQSFFIDPVSVTALFTNSKEGALTVYNEKGVLLWINYKSYKVDPDKLLEKLAKAGNPLISLPARESGKEYPYYIAPSAVMYATVTTVTAEGDMGAIIGIKGAGRHESYGTKPEEFQALLGGMKAAGKTMLEYMPDVAYARWYDAAMLYIDPAAITSIRDDGLQLNIYFGDSDLLDVQVKLSQEKKQQIHDTLIGPFTKESSLNSTVDLLKVVPRALHEEESQARRNVAAAIAAANRALIPVTNTLHRGVYVRPEDVNYVTFYDDKKDTRPEGKYEMRLHRQKAGSTYHDTLNVYFNSAAARTESFEALMGTKKPSSPKKDPGQTP